MATSKFHLQNRFPGLGAVCKNIQDHFLSIDYFFAAEFFQVPLLGGTQWIVKDDHIRFCCRCGFFQFLRLAAADIKFRIRFPDPDRHFATDINTQRVHQFAQFGEVFPHISKRPVGIATANEKGFQTDGCSTFGDITHAALLRDKKRGEIKFFVLDEVGGTGENGKRSHHAKDPEPYIMQNTVRTDIRDQFDP